MVHISNLLSMTICVRVPMSVTFLEGFKENMRLGSDFTKRGQA